ncbi:uncharacterized protein NESG_01065 [Nematocida ausubeli]|uniref:Uncharacterized protein n=1 Tax=Nematocida ausubeli (strain ATCC PRA-371 / ERTm2) TaxID=1913371 RepID=A0A086J441_NEMA1|nr:uncharacterized protein NESG_01065 [Nematocida ausubeli]KAI5132339.1 hypothetical protein NEAUS07_0101 [Nematocida ausubeli]KAI5147005.1 hypothetical protein NEAUS05_0337 [Nematocida ausubeli]KFG26909.1 hypothetical protein NESG_01065 [Nematocida ausubeli]
MRVWAWVISMVAVHKICANMEMPAIEKVLNSRFGENSMIMVHPEGPLSPLNAYISRKCNFMYNKRFFSPEIETNYELSMEKDPEMNRPKYIRTRRFNKDKVHVNAGIKNKKLTAAQEYHAVLLKLFPSPIGDLTIHTSINNSFITFLSDQKVSQHAHKILAALLLMTEGIDVPLSLSGTKGNKKLTLKSAKNSTVHFCLDMHVPRMVAIEKDKIEKTEVYQSEAVFIIEYFKKNKPELPLPEGDAPVVYDDFKKGEFLNSPKWLLQSYVFEYISGHEDALSFANTVHDMLFEFMSSEAYGDTEHSSIKKIFYEYFALHSEVSQRFDYLSIIKKVQSTDLKYKVFPFAGDTYVPSYQSTPVYDREKGSFTMQQFSNCVEASAFGLLCCLAYDPDTKKYSTEHMPGATKNLVNFFKKYESTHEPINQIVYKEWSKVVSGLEGEQIKYMRENKNELASGILNVLCLVATITGVYETEKHRLQEFIEAVNNKVCKKGIYAEIQEYAEYLFRSLSVRVGEEEDSPMHNSVWSCLATGPPNSKNRSIEVELKNIKVGSCLEGKKDLFGNIFITYKKDELRGGMVMACLPKHMGLVPIPSIDSNLTYFSNKLTRLLWKVTLNRKTTFTSCLVRYYIEQTKRKCLYEHQKLKEIQKIIVQIEPLSFIGIERLLLLDIYQTIENKKSLVFYIAMHTMGKKLNSDDLEIRLISNILASVPLDDQQTLSSFMSCFITSGVQTNLVLKLFPEKKMPVVYNYDPQKLSDAFVYCIKHMNSPNALVQLIRKTMDLGKMSLSCCFPQILKNDLSLKKKIQLLSCLTENGRTIQHLVTIAEILKDLDKKGRSIGHMDLKANDAWALWISIACQKERLRGIIPKCFDAMVYTEGTIVTSYLIEVGRSYRKFNQKVLSVMDSMKSDLCRTHEDKIKYELLMDIYRSRQNNYACKIVRTRVIP